MNLGHIAVRDLSAEKTGSDETKDGECRDDDHMLIASPRERKVRPHEFDEAIKGPSSKKEEKRNKNASKKCINHNTARRGK